ncbi:MAG: carboxymuconolactone decarboxylase family protein [Deltaproteobacteria bacterium]|nr:carboxymuconolactone decarboxylase family protein [Deltaproteobacteria bacterium]
MSAIEDVRAKLPPAARDLSLNLASVLGGESVLSAAQRWGVAVAAAIASREPGLRDAVIEEARTVAPESAIEDAVAGAALMGMNNVLYRFRHFLADQGRQSYDAHPARLRMQRLVRPAGAKVDFELVCLAVSAIHGCERCVVAHERAVIEGGLGPEHVFEAVRIAATIHGAAVALESASIAAPVSAAA